MRRSLRPTLIKFGVFGIVMAVLTASLFFIFGQYQTGSTNDYSAVFKDASRLKVGQSVRVGGMRIGTVNGVKLQKDKTALVTFDADPAVQMTDGTRVAVRYLNLVGDRYLELIDGPGGRKLPPGIADPRGTHSRCTGPRPAARRPQTRYPRPQSAGRQRPFGVADPDLPRPGRHPAVPAVQHVGVHHRVGGTQPDDPGTDRQPAHVAVHPHARRARSSPARSPSWRRW